MTRIPYHIHKREPLQANDVLTYQYVLSRNGVFVRAKTRLFTALLPITTCIVCKPATAPKPNGSRALTGHMV